MTRVETPSAPALVEVVDQPHPAVLIRRTDGGVCPPWRLGLTASFLSCLLLCIAGRAVDVPGLALGGTFGILLFGLGAAPLQLAREPSISARLGVATLVALSTTFVVGALLVLTPLWHPVFAVAVVLAVASCVHAFALPASLAELRAWRVRIDRSPPPRGWSIRPSGVCTLLGTGVWLLSAISAGRIVPGIGGFLVDITPFWYAGLLLVLAGIAFARGAPEAYAVVGVTSLVLALTLTPALIYGMPRSQSAGKHIEIVQLILRSHRLHASSGIYAAYSAFFAGIAWVCRIAHVKDSVGIATLWPMVMGLARILELRFFFGQVLDGRYRRWAAITLVVLVDAIGADYFSPQAAGYALGLGVFALALNRRSYVDGRIKAAVILLAGCGLAITHELSPYIVGGVLLVLGLARCIEPRWAGLGVLAPAGLWALINHNVLKGYFSLSSLGNLSNFAPPPLAARPGLTRDAIVGNSSHALLLGLLVLIAGALVGFAQHRRNRWAWAYLVSAGVGLVFVAVNPYGNEGIFRASLFAIPWLAALAMSIVRLPKPVLRAPLWMGLTTGLMATFLVAAFGMDGSGVMRKQDLTALRVFTYGAPRGSFLLDLGFSDLPSSPPTLVSANHLLAFTSVDDARFQMPGHPTAEDLRLMLRSYERVARQQAGSRLGGLYVVWSPVSAIYAKEYGLELPSQADEWRNLLWKSPNWRVVYSSRGSYLFRAIVHRRGARRRPKASPRRAPAKAS